jgi:hypothetical protein
MEEEAHGIVIVGSGICGLATALALHRCVHSCSSYSTVFPSNPSPCSIAQIVVYFHFLCPAARAASLVVLRTGRMGVPGEKDEEKERKNK